MGSELKIVISGSFRKNLDAIGVARTNFRRSGVKVIAPLTHEAKKAKNNFVLLKTDHPNKTPYLLEKEFIDNIKKVDFMYLANISGYIGQSMAAEMAVALMHGVPVIAVDKKIMYFSADIPQTAHKLLSKSVFHSFQLIKSAR